MNPDCSCLFCGGNMTFRWRPMSVPVYRCQDCAVVIELAQGWQFSAVQLISGIGAELGHEIQISAKKHWKQSTGGCLMPLKQDIEGFTNG